MIYIGIGLLWTLWLEWYTTNEIDGFMGRPWVWRERLFHISLWPISIGTFVLEIINQLRK
jgi:hypothetical protein